MMTSLSMEDLKMLFSEVIDEKLIKHILQTDQPQKTEFITRKEAAKLLGISLPTLHKLTQTGKLASFRIGSQVRYNKKELINSLKIKYK